MAQSNLPPQFFVDYKKGEVNELKTLLNNPSIDKDVTKKKDVIKRVIAYMTLGVDVSKLFPEMVKASFTTDIVTKKMIFLYLINYAEDNELSILAINTFLKDVKSDNAKIRGLALRSLCSLNYKSAYDYYSGALYDSLKDNSPYVRKTAVMGLLKVHNLNPKLISDKDIDTLYEMIKDNDPLVVSNTLYALNEILKNEGGIAITGKMIIYLLNRIKDFNEWGQNIVLGLVSRYEPKDENQLFDILNILEDRLKHSSSAIVLSCTKVFINFTKKNEFIYNQVLKRLKDPLITLMTSGEISGNYELSYVILSHIYMILVKNGKEVFSDLYKKFYIKFEEPLYIKKKKLKILFELTNQNNYQDILNELEEYVSDINSKFSTKAIRCIGKIGMSLDCALSNVVLLLKTLISRNADYIVSETLIVLQNLFRKYQNIVGDFLPSLEPCIQLINNDQRGLSALVFILGEYGEKLENSPYILENLIDNFTDVQSSEIIYSILLSSIKLFFKTPGEMQSILGRVFELILKNYNDVDLRDRTYFFYNLMQSDINLAEKIICGELATLEGFSNNLEGEYLDKIYSQFNTLSIIYNKPEEKFIKSENLSLIDHTEHLIKKDSETKEPETTKTEVKNETVSVPSSQTVDLIGLGSVTAQPDLLNTNFSQNKLDLAPEATIGQNEFQSIWKGIQTAAKKEIMLSTTDIDLEEFVKYLQSKSIMCIASGNANNNIKLFLYSLDKNSKSYILSEVIIQVLTNNMIYNIKSQNSGNVKEYEEYFLEVFSPLT